MKTLASPIPRRSALSATIVLLLVSAPAVAEKRLVVGGLDKDSHLSYTFKGDSPVFNVKVNRPSLPKVVTISNDTGRAIKVHFFNASDKVRAIPKRSTTLKDGKSVSWPYQLYSIKVYEPKLIDKRVLTKLNINSDVVIKKKSGDYSAIVTKVPDFTVTNNSTESIVAYIYNEGDIVRLIARKSFTIGPKEKATWADPTIDTFRVRIHRAKFMANPVSEARNANVRTSIVVEELEWSPWKKLMLAEWKNGKLNHTNTPKVIPSLDGITAGLEGYAAAKSQTWPEIYAHAPENGLYVQTMLDGRMDDFIINVKDSADWELGDFVGALKPRFPGQIGSTPTVVADGSAGTDRAIFARGPYGNLVTKGMYTGAAALNTAGGWTDLGGNLDSRPTAVSIGGGKSRRLMVAVRDAGTNSLRVRFRDKDKKWGAWENLGADLIGSPAACTGVYGSGSATGVAQRVDVFARGRDNTLRHRAWLEGEGWQAWKNLGGNLASDPAVYSESDKNPWPNERTAKTRYHVVALGPSGNAIYRHYDGTAWSDWKSLGGKFTSAPVVFFSDDLN